MRPYHKHNSHKQRLLDDIKLLIKNYPKASVICDKYRYDGCGSCSLRKFYKPLGSGYHCSELKKIFEKHVKNGSGLDFLNTVRRVVKTTPREKLTPYYIKTIGIPRPLHKEFKKWIKAVSSCPDDSRATNRGRLSHPPPGSAY